MNAVAHDQQIDAALHQSRHSSWAVYKGTSDDRLVFAHIDQPEDTSPKVSIFYRPGPGQPLRLELVVTEKLIDDSNEGIDDYFYAMVNLLKWLGGVLQDAGWANAFPLDDAFIVQEAAGATWEQPGAWKYYRG